MIHQGSALLGSQCRRLKVIDWVYDRYSTGGIDNRNQFSRNNDLPLFTDYETPVGADGCFLFLPPWRRRGALYSAVSMFRSEVQESMSCRGHEA